MDNREYLRKRKYLQQRKYARRKRLKRLVISAVALVFVFAVIVFVIRGCGNDEEVSDSVSGTSTGWMGGDATGKPNASSKDEAGASNPMAVPTQEPTFIDAEGSTLENRILTPEGYTRIAQESGSLGTFIRRYTMKADGADVLLYDGKKKGNQSDHAAVFALPIENRDLQQCADSVMRMYGEYLWSSGQYDRIAFHFTNGFLAKYSKWREGYRIMVEGNDVSWSKTKEYDDSYECFVSFMRMVFAYAGTLSMESETTPITLEELQIGDVFLSGGSPGHVVMVVDICENEAGEKAFLLAQGYMPAQEFHVLKNPAHTYDPWYYEGEVTYPFRTPQYTFYEGSLRRLNY